jgi:hypothetical protein
MISAENPDGFRSNVVFLVPALQFVNVTDGTKTGSPVPIGSTIHSAVRPLEMISWGAGMWTLVYFPVVMFYMQAYLWFGLGAQTRTETVSPVVIGKLSTLSGGSL